LLEREPANLNVRRTLASLLVNDGDIESARNVLQKGLALSPRDMQLITDNVALELRVGGLDAALAAADRFQRQNSDFVPVRAMKGDLYLGAKQYDKAIDAYTTAIKESPPDSALALRLASAMALSGKPDEAKIGLETWLKMNPDDLAALQYLSGLNINAHKYPEAQAQLEKILAKRPHDAATLNNLAWIYQQLGDKRARATAQQAYVLLPNAQTADTLGWILVGEGDKTGTVLLRQANAEGGNDPRIKYHYAVALKQAGNKEEAVKLLTQVVASDGNFDEKAAAKTLLEELTKA
jgi:Flp pilus assembly protein TadD